MAGSATGSGGSDDTTGPVNEVRIVGRLAAPGEVRELPSGDSIAVFRVVVARPSTAPSRAAGARRGASVDTIDCVAWRASARRTVTGWCAGDVVEVTGALRRRFWRGAAGAASRTEVEVGRARRVRRAGAATGS